MGKACRKGQRPIRAQDSKKSRDKEIEEQGAEDEKEAEDEKPKLMTKGQRGRVVAGQKIAARTRTNSAQHQSPGFQFKSSSRA